MTRQLTFSEAINEWEACSQKNIIDKTLQFYGNIFLQNQILTKVDRTSMMHGLEVRSPFLDIDFINCVRRIPSYYKIRKGHSKYIFKSKPSVKSYIKFLGTSGYTRIFDYMMFTLLSFISSNIQNGCS